MRRTLPDRRRSFHTEGVAERDSQGIPIDQALSSPGSSEVPARKRIDAIGDWYRMGAGVGAGWFSRKLPDRCSNRIIAWCSHGFRRQAKVGIHASWQEFTARRIHPLHHCLRHVTRLEPAGRVSVGEHGAHEGNSGRDRRVNFSWCVVELSNAPLVCVSRYQRACWRS